MRELGPEDKRGDDDVSLFPTLDINKSRVVFEVPVLNALKIPELYNEEDSQELKPTMSDNKSHRSNDSMSISLRHPTITSSSGVVEVVRRKSYIFTKRINVTGDCNKPYGNQDCGDELQGQVVTCHYRNRNNCENLSKITIASVALPDTKVKPSEDRASPLCWHGLNGASEVNENEYCKKTPMSIVCEETKRPVADQNNNNNNNKNNRKDLKKYQTEKDVRMSLKAYDISQHDTVRFNFVSKSVSIPSRQQRDQEYHRYSLSETSSDSLITQCTFTASDLESDCELPGSVGPDNYTKTTSSTRQQERSENLLVHASEISSPKAALFKHGLKDYSSLGSVLRYRKKKPMNTMRIRNSNADADDEIELTDDSNSSEMTKTYEKKVNREFEIVESSDVDDRGGMRNRNTLAQVSNAESTGDEAWNYGEILDYSSTSCQHTPLPTPPPSALKKSGSTSGSSIGKKQKVQFDPAIEIHFVPRDSYPTPESIVNGSTNGGVEIEEVEDDRYSEFSTENDFDENESYNPLIYDENILKGPFQSSDSPFTVIKRETPSSRSRRGQRRDSLDLTQVHKVFNQQSRDRAVQIQRIGGTTDHERRYPRTPYATAKHTQQNYRISNGSYYSTREQQRSRIEESKMLMRNNMMSPEHYVAYYTRQQQLQQYLEHERRLRRQQLLSGNIKRKDERKDKLTTRNEFFESLNDGVNEEMKKQGEKEETGDSLSCYPSKPRLFLDSRKSQQHQLSHDEQSRLSSGYGGSNTGSDDILHSDVSEKVELNKNLFLNNELSNIKSGYSRTIDGQQPYTPRQVAEVIRAAGSAMRNGGNITYYSEKNKRRESDLESKLNTSNQEQQYRNDNDFASNAKGNFSKLSENARSALHHAHFAYTASLSNMMPATKSAEEINVSKSNFSTMPSIRKNNLSATSQPTVRHLHGNTRGKFPQSFTRLQKHKRTDLADGNSVHGLRTGSGRMGNHSGISSSSSFQTSTGNSRPSTAESVTINVLGLSARLPASHRFSAQPVRGHFNSIRSVKPLARSSNDAIGRMSSANKARYMRSKYDDHKKMTELHVLNDVQSGANQGIDFAENVNVPNLTSCYTARKTIDDNNLKPDRTGPPPQLRGNHHPYHGHKSRKRSTTSNPGVSQAPQSSLAAPPKILA